MDSNNQTYQTVREGEGDASVLVEDYDTIEFQSLMNGVSYGTYLPPPPDMEPAYESNAVNQTIADLQEMESTKFQTLAKYEKPQDTFFTMYPSEMPLLQNVSIQIDPHPETISWSEDREFEFSQMATGVLERLKGLEYELIYGQYFRGRLRKRKSILGQVLDERQILSYQNYAIKVPLLMIDDSLASSAVGLFQLTLKFMEVAYSLKSQCTTTDKLTEIAYTIISQLVGARQELIDEVYTQLIKQLNKCPRKHYMVRLYQLLSVYNYSIRPSKPLNLALLNYFLARYIQIKDPDESQFLRYLFPRFIRQLKLESSKSVPDKVQILSLMTQRQLCIPVFLCSGESVKIWVEYYECMLQLRRKVLDRLGIDTAVVHSSYFGIFMIINAENQLSESHIAEDQTVWSVVSNWGSNQKSFNFLMFKIVWVYAHHPEDALSQQLIFSQSLYDLVSGKMTLDEPQVDQFVTLLSQDHSKAKQLMNSIKFFPANSFNKKLLQQSTQVANQGVVLPKLISILRTSHQFMCNNFRVRYSQSEIARDTGYILSIKPFNFFISREGEYHATHHYSMQDLVQCKLLGETSVSVSTIDFKEHMIESRQADAIYSLLEEFGTLKGMLTNSKPINLDYMYQVDYSNYATPPKNNDPQMQQFDYEL